MKKGRPLENDTLILKYTQTFKDHKGEVVIWDWDKTKFSNGPLSVEIKDPQWNTFDKLENKLNSILSKYEIKGNQRKPRITKIDKIEIERLEKEMNEIFYDFYPEDRPKVRKNAKHK
jgi:uncharacterized protein YxjI